LSELVAPTVRSTSLSRYRRVEKVAELPRLGGRVVVLGSAPGATLPQGLGENWTLATVNASQAAIPGSRAPDITLFNNDLLGRRDVNRQARRQLAGRSTEVLICTLKRHPWRVWLGLARLRYRRRATYFITIETRARLISEVLGMPIENAERPSTGVALALISAGLGASEVIMVGFSLTQAGHVYNDMMYPREHADPDRKVLAIAARAGLPIFTTDPVFSAESSIPIWPGKVG
jgi:hypothetical protein